MPYYSFRPSLFTSQSAGSLNNLVDLFKRLHELLVVVAPDLVSRYEISVEVIQLRIPLAHVLAEKCDKIFRDLNKDEEPIKEI